MAQVDESITRGAALDRWTANLSRALGSLADRSMLSANPLARFDYVQRLAADKYRDRIMPRGLALRDIVSGCVDRIVTEVANEPRLDRAAKYLVLRSRGLSGQRIAAELRLSREHVARTVRRQALQLLLEQFLLMTRGVNGEALPPHPGSLTAWWQSTCQPPVRIVLDGVAGQGSRLVVSRTAARGEEELP